MHTRLWIATAVATCTLALAGCAAGPNQQLGVGAGALGGAALGNAIGGNTASTVGGAAIGGLIGNEVGRRADQRRYNDNYYYPNNGPRY